MSFVVFAFIERGRNRACLITKLGKILDIRAMHAYDLACFDKKTLQKTHVKTAASIWIHTIQQIDGKSIVGLITGNEDPGISYDRELGFHFPHQWKPYPLEDIDYMTSDLYVQSSLKNEDKGTFILAGVIADITPAPVDTLLHSHTGSASPTSPNIPLMPSLLSQTEITCL